MLTGSLVPIGAILLRARHGGLGADPIAQALNQLGLIALVLLSATLACTPLKLLLGWTWPMRIRRMLGVLAFLYAVFHVTTYTVLDQGLPARPQLGVRILDDWLAADAGHGCHMEDLDAPAPDIAAAVQAPAVTVKWRQSGQGGNLFAIKCAQFGQVGEQRTRKLSLSKIPSEPALARIEIE